jgi:tripartite-type tricarboxylate transporter receptor subunit TctC
MKRFAISFGMAVLSTCLVVAATGQAFGQAYPAKPVHMTVGFAPGGIADVVTRLLANALTGPLGQPVVVENKPGADGRIALQQLAAAAPDGYTIGLADAGLAVNAVMFQQKSYDPLKDFTPLLYIGEAANFIAVNPSLPVSTLGEFIAYAKARPGQLNYAATASSTMLGGELFKARAGLDIVAVRYKGQAQGLPAVMAGECQLMVSSVGPLAPFVKDGKLKALAVTSAKRSPLAPDVPTAVEAGLPGMVYVNWYVVLAPPALPKAIADRLQADLRKALADPAVIARLQQMGITPAPASPEEFVTMLKGELVKMENIVKTANIKVD